MRWPLALAAGLAQAAIFPPFNAGWLCWISLPLLLAALWIPETKAPPRTLTCFALGFTAGLGIFIGSFHWLTSVHAAGWIALSCYLAIYPALWAVAAGSILRPDFPEYSAPTPRISVAPIVPPRHPLLSSTGNIGRAAALAALWTTLEYLRSTVFTGFGWNTLGLGLRDNIPLTQICSVTGAPGLSFLIAFVSVIMYGSIRRLALEVGRRGVRAHFDFHAAMLLLVGVFAFGAARIREEVETTPLKISLIQANIPQDQKWDAEFAQSILQTYQDLTEAAAATKPDMILWPEAATPVSMFGDEQTFRMVTGLASTTRTPLLVGTLDFDEHADFNAVALVPAEPGHIQVYRKMHLVPFGEFIPFRHSFPLFAWIAGDLVPGDFQKGAEPVPMHLWSKHIAFAPLICFEDTLGELVTRFSARGAQLLVNVTNDGWFLETSGSEQHLANARLRTVETGLPMVRVANTGVSCIIDRLGRTQRDLRDDAGRPFVKGILTESVDVPVQPEPTFYTLHGDLFSHVCLVVALLPLLLGIARRYRPNITEAILPVSPSPPFPSHGPR